MLATRGYIKMGNFEEALAFLKRNKNKVVDTVAKADYFGQIYLALGSEQEAVNAYESLLQLNSANLDTYKKIIKAKGIDIPKDISIKLSEAY